MKLMKLLLIYAFLSILSQAKALRLRKLQEDTDFDLSKLRILAMGASATWGASLPDRYTAYPYQLKPANVTNLAIRSSGPTYPSICLETMIGDDAVYDVIILEYLMRARDGLETLALRLRKRYPNAIIIFNILWAASNLMGYDQNNNIVPFHEVWRKYKYMLPMKPEYISTIKSELKNITYLPQMKSLIQYTERISQSVGGHLLGLDYSQCVGFQPCAEDWSDEWVFDKLSLMNDLVHWSQKGHDHLANSIKKMLSKLEAKPSNVLGTWGDGDACHMWYNSGVVDVEYHPKKEINLVEFAPEKFALEIPYHGGEIILNNPFSMNRNVVITYMATGPTSCIYPRVEVTINASQNKTSIHPLINQYDFDVHLAVSMNIGLVPPGRNSIFIKPIEVKGGVIRHNFRLSAISVVGDGVDVSGIVPVGRITDN